MLVNSSRWYQSSYSLTAQRYMTSRPLSIVCLWMCVADYIWLRVGVKVCVRVSVYIREGVCHLTRGWSNTRPRKRPFFSGGFPLPPFLGKGGFTFGPSPSLLQQRITRFHEPIITSSPRSTQFLFIPGISIRFVRSLNRIFMYIYSLHSFQ